LDGIERVGWMIKAWSYAIKSSEIHFKPTFDDVLYLGKLIETDKVAGIRTCEVRIGYNFCPKFELVPRLLAQLFEAVDNLTPAEFYHEFELIHPFVDGNGRVGKILFNWLNGTLLDPIFPPNFFEKN
jgi:Fic/DOC family protein